jgi:hypothetical protein
MNAAHRVVSNVLQRYELDLLPEIIPTAIANDPQVRDELVERLWQLHGGCHHMPEKAVLIELVDAVLAYLRGESGEKG